MLKMKWGAIAAACVLSLLSLTGCPAPTLPSGPGSVEPVAVTGISIPASLSMQVGGTQTLSATVTPDNATDKSLSWSSSNSAVATVDTSGKVVAVAAGTATITATSVSTPSITDSCFVTVTPGVVPLSAPTALFKDAGLTYVVSPAAATTQKAMLTSWESNDKIENTANDGPAKITFGGHPGGWSGAIALIQRPTGMVGFYNLSSVATIKFRIRTAISPANLCFVMENDAKRTATLDTFGVTSLADWTDVSVDAASLVGSSSASTFTTVFAFFWGKNDQDKTSIVKDQFIEIGNIEYLDASGNAVNFHANILPAPVTPAPTTLPAAPSLAAADVVSLHTSSNTYTNATVNNWNAGWGQSGTMSDVTVATKTVKLLDLVDPRLYQGVEIADKASPLNITGKKTLHISYWTSNGVNLQVFPIKDGGEYAIDVGTITKDAWTELEIPITDATYNNIIQLKFVTTGAAKFYLDNIYFH